MMNITQLLKKCERDIINYRLYLESMPTQFKPAFEQSAVNIERIYSDLLRDQLPPEIYKELMWIDWEFPNADYESIDDFINQHK